MAKLGEGDDRWIVKDRADGANVHGWHWQEKDCLPWTKERFSDLLEGLQVLNGENMIFLKVTKVESVTGDCYVNIRKGKKIPGYEIELKATWEGEIRENGKPDGEVIAKAAGGVHLPYIADENADEDPEVKITTQKEGPAFTKMKEAMLKQGKKLIVEKMKVWQKELEAGGPGGDGPAPAPAAPKPAAAAAAAPAPAAEKKKEKSKMSGRTIKLTEKFYCRPIDIFGVMTDVPRIQTFTQSPAEFDASPGGKFSMFGGSVQGINVELVPGEKMVQKWRFSNWEEGYYSMVTITFKEPEPGNTILSLVQEGVPEEDAFGNHSVYDQTENGWKNLIFHKIRSIFGFGV
mmetsp:Transcript_40416/g.49019  ORF Transcript_40416/g.49019 Transcript_40416/m.49019 type:complete len:346 (+) Transcript_40416:128-1165(+)|eukprot:CAMPEP_0197848162 /NCGR_PEP_ID=MMETSP1438-20131217/7960_1 /TAXON_ID=1461541 /ORGANISM="Pterosperma sp., Strain CCMP1384" /LENGTH=345 /DNA_ID=CAMNT_0043460301 /DNA_START=128 /DNA_END=1165 /DNA_ORIENTATION=-